MKPIILGVLLLFPLNLGLAQSETGRAVIGGSVSDPDNNFVSGAGDCSTPAIPPEFLRLLPERTGLADYARLNWD